MCISTARARAKWLSRSGSGIPVSFRAIWLLSDVHVHVDCAGSHKVVVAFLGRGSFLVNSRVALFL